jgi:hypothetical protein
MDRRCDSVAAYLARDYDILVRVGGPNAGHSVSSASGIYVYHQLPSGTMDTNARVLLGPGMTINVDRLRARSPAIPNVIDENRCRQLHGIALADRVSFEKLQGRLFGALPIGDVFEGLDIPLDEVGQGKGTVSGFNERRRVLQVHFPRPSQFLCRRPQLESLRLSMDDDPILLDPDIGCVPNPGVTHTS